MTCRPLNLQHFRWLLLQILQLMLPLPLALPLKPLMPCKHSNFNFILPSFCSPFMRIYITGSLCEPNELHQSWWSSIGIFKRMYNSLFFYLSIYLCLCVFVIMFTHRCRYKYSYIPMLSNMNQQDKPNSSNNRHTWIDVFVFNRIRKICNLMTMSTDWDEWVLVPAIEWEWEKTCAKYLKKLKTIFYYAVLCALCGIWTQVSSLQADILQLAISFKYFKQQTYTKSRNYTVQNLLHRRKIIPFFVHSSTCGDS